MLLTHKPVVIETSKSFQIKAYTFQQVAYIHKVEEHMFKTFCVWSGERDANGA